METGTAARSEPTPGERLVAGARRVGVLEQHRVVFACRGQGRVDAMRERAHALHERLHHAPRWVRVSLGVLFVLGGVAGILPVLGFWMVPLGLAILAIDVPPIRRFWCRVTDWWHRRRGTEPSEHHRKVCRVHADDDEPRGFIDPAPPMHGT